jgi:NAD(P)-dependent dehydrogenase (short-subunit alcohol dehydrogenase family)
MLSAHKTRKNALKAQGKKVAEYPAEGCTFLVTGVSEGSLGAATAVALADAGARVVYTVHSGNEQRMHNHLLTVSKRQARCKEEPDGPCGRRALELLPVTFDTAHLTNLSALDASLKQKVAQRELLGHLDGIILASGALQNTRRTRKDAAVLRKELGVDRVVDPHAQEHLLGPLAVAQGLMPHLLRGRVGEHASLTCPLFATPRIITVSSLAHWAGQLSWNSSRAPDGTWIYETAPTTFAAFARDRLASLLFVSTMQKRYAPYLDFIAAAPSLSLTHLYDHHPMAFGAIDALDVLGFVSTPDQGAGPIVWSALSKAAGRAAAGTLATSNHASPHWVSPFAVTETAEQDLLRGIARYTKMRFIPREVIASIREMPAVPEEAPGAEAQTQQQMLQQQMPHGAKLEAQRQFMKEQQEMHARRAQRGESQ